MKILCLDTDSRLAMSVANQLNCDVLKPEQRCFPDGEHYLRLVENINSEDVFLFSSLHQPDHKILPLIFMANFLREEGARRIILVTPYLPYMRQDIQFHPGEIVTSRYFSALISNAVDGLITVDPHLHRYHSLDEIYSIPSCVIHATSVIANWIRNSIDAPIIIGPDEESSQWAEDVAKAAGCPVAILKKTRYGDRDVRIQWDDLTAYRQHQPVLIDDIISTGKTVIETANLMVAEGLKAPVVIGVHAVLAEGAQQELDQATLKDWLTCNTIPHSSNGIDVSVEITAAIRTFILKEDV